MAGHADYHVLYREIDCVSLLPQCYRFCNEMCLAAMTDWLGERCRIGPYLLDARAELLTLDHAPVQLGRRAVNVLLLLLNRAGQLVTKDELIEQAWHGVVVEENNLAAQITALRRAFSHTQDGAGWIETLPRRGYRFVGPVEWQSDLPVPMPTPRSPRPGNGRPSIAVLPFSTPPPNPLPSYVADGLVENITSALSGLSEFSVISRNSTYRYRSAEPDLAMIGRELDVRYLVTGSIRRAGTRARVLGELVEAATGSLLVSRIHEGFEEAAFDAPDELVHAIVRTLAPRVRAEELRRIRAQRPSDWHAYHLMLQARELIHRLDRTDADKAEALLKQALTIDPDYGAVHSTMWELMSLRLGQNWSRDRAADIAVADRYVKTAIELDPGDAVALARYGHGRSFLHQDFGAAVELFERALDCNPNCAEAWMWSSVTQSYLGNGPLAVEHAKCALRLSPLDWNSFRYHSTLSLGHYVNGTMSEAIRWGRLATQENPNDLALLRYNAAAFAAGNALAEAQAMVRLAMAIDPDFSARVFMEHVRFQPAELRSRFEIDMISAGFPK